MSAANDNDLKLAGDLIDGLLGPELTQELEQRRKTDADFEEVIRWQLTLRREVANKEKLRLKEILKNERLRQQRQYRAKTGAFVLAALLFLALLGYIFWPSPPTNEAVYATYYEPYPWTLKSPDRGPGETANLLSSAYRAYRNPLTDSSVPTFERLVAAAPDSAEYQFLYANLLLERGEFERAIPILESLEDGKVDRRSYYLGLAYLAAGNREKALEFFKAVGADERYFADRVKNIIAELE